MLRTIARMGAGALLGMAILLVPAGSAQAADGGLLLDVPGDGAGFVDNSTTPLLNFDDLMPGDSKSAELQVRNDHSKTVALSLQAVDVRDLENGCPEPERNEGGDTTCDGTNGDLAPWLDLTITRTGATAELLWSGDLTELTAGQVLLASDMPSGAVWTVRVSVTFDPAAGNVTMTDEVEFDLAWSALDDTLEPPGLVPNEPNPDPEGPGPGPDNSQGGGGEKTPPEIAGESEPVGEVEIAGVQASRPRTDSGLDGVTLPFTGVTVESWLVWFAGVLTIGGGGLMAWSRLPQGAAPMLRRSQT